MLYDVANRIKYLRDKAGIKQIELAKRLGISRSAVNSWEMSLSMPSVSNIVEMTQIFHVSADYLLSLSEPLAVDISTLNDDEKEVVIRLVKCLSNKTR